MVIEVDKVAEEEGVATDEVEAVEAVEAAMSPEGLREREGEVVEGRLHQKAEHLMLGSGTVTCVACCLTTQHLRRGFAWLDVAKGKLGYWLVRIQS